MQTQDYRGVYGPALPPHWRRYRDGYVLLQHLHNLEGETEGEPALASRLAHDLGVTRAYLDEVTDYLVGQGYLVFGGAGGSLRLTAAARAYLDRRANRRRSVRPAAQNGRHPLAEEVPPTDPAGILRLRHRPWPGVPDLYQGLRQLRLAVQAVTTAPLAFPPPILPRLPGY
jgi:hypothetical protein